MMARHIQDWISGVLQHQEKSSFEKRSGRLNPAATPSSFITSSYYTTMPSGRKSKKDGQAQGSAPRTQPGTTERLAPSGMATGEQSDLGSSSNSRPRRFVNKVLSTGKSKTTPLDASSSRPKPQSGKLRTTLSIATCLG
jgi:hypothetical protein